MTGPGPVIVGYDGGASGADAIALGLRYAGLLGAPPVIAVVYPEPAPIGPGRVDAEWVAARQQQAAEALETAKGVVAGLPVAAPELSAPEPEYRLHASSSAAHGLSDLAGQLGGSAIVVGSSAVEGGPARIFAGSTASRLLHGAAAPVAVAPKGLRDVGWWPEGGIGVAFVDTAEAKLALAAAAALAVRVGAPLRIYTVVAAETRLVPWLIGVDAEHAFSAAAAEAFGQAVDAAAAGLPSGLTVERELLVGDVVEMLAEITDVQLLFCGSRGYGPVRSVLLGGVSSRLVRRARAPLVVIPRPS